MISPINCYTSEVLYYKTNWIFKQFSIKSEKNICSYNKIYILYEIRLLKILNN